MKRIYHGSVDIIPNPKLHLGKMNNDYGQGFYCTEDMELAKEWAAKHNIKCYVNEYDLNISKLKVLNLLSDNYNVLHWITILIKNRQFNLITPFSIKAKEYLISNYTIDTSGYDIIIGYRADDSYFAIAKAFLNNNLSLSKLDLALKLGDLGTQIVLISNKAFDELKFIKSHEFDYKLYHKIFNIRDETAREVFFEEFKKNEVIDDDIYIMDLIRSGGQ